jgi:hypothetical protein
VTNKCAQLACKTNAILSNVSCTFIISLLLLLLLFLSVRSIIRWLFVLLLNCVTVCALAECLFYFVSLAKALYRMDYILTCAFRSYNFAVILLHVVTGLKLFTGLLYFDRLPRAYRFVAGQLIDQLTYLINICNVCRPLARSRPKPIRQVHITSAVPLAASP